jgi:hypothetical protein
MIWWNVALWDSLKLKVVCFDFIDTLNWSCLKFITFVILFGNFSTIMIVFSKVSVAIRIIIVRKLFILNFILVIIWMILLKCTSFVKWIWILIYLIDAIWSIRITKFACLFNWIKLKLLSSVILFVSFVILIVIQLIIFYLLLIIVVTYGIICMIVFIFLHILGILCVIIIIVSRVKGNSKIFLHLLVINWFLLASCSP